MKQRDADGTFGEAVPAESLKTAAKKRDNVCSALKGKAHWQQGGKGVKGPLTEERVKENAAWVEVAPLVEAAHKQYESFKVTSGNSLFEPIVNRVAVCKQLYDAAVAIEAQFDGGDLDLDKFLGAKSDAPGLATVREAMPTRYARYRVCAVAAHVFAVLRSSGDYSTANYCYSQLFRKLYDLNDDAAVRAHDEEMGEFLSRVRLQSVGYTPSSRDSKKRGRAASSASDGDGDVAEPVTTGRPAPSPRGGSNSAGNSSRGRASRRGGPGGTPNRGVEKRRVHASGQPSLSPDDRHPLWDSAQAAGLSDEQARVALTKSIYQRGLTAIDLRRKLASLKCDLEQNNLALECEKEELSAIQERLDLKERRPLREPAKAASGAARPSSAIVASSSSEEDVDGDLGGSDKGEEAASEPGDSSDQEEAAAAAAQPPSPSPATAAAPAPAAPVPPTSASVDGDREGAEGPKQRQRARGGAAARGGASAKASRGRVDRKSVV